jgi:hypothetical protein
MLLVAGHNDLRVCGQGALEDHLIARIGGGAGGALGGKNERGRLSQAGGPRHMRASRVIKPQFPHRFVVLGQ